MTALLEFPEARPLESEKAPEPWKWTRKQYYELAEKGYFAGKRVELIEGEIISMPAVNFPHTAASTFTQRKLEAAFGPDYWVRPQMPIECGKSEPEPDLAVVLGGPADYSSHPKSALLIVEVSDTTLGFDTGKKALLYAQGGNLDYWVLDLNGQRLIVFREPSKRGYASETIFRRVDFVTALAAPQVPIKVADLLP